MCRNNTYRDIFKFLQGCIKPQKIIFLPPPPTFENHFFIQVTTFGCSAAVHNIWWQHWDTTFGCSCGIQIHKKIKKYREK